MDFFKDTDKKNFDFEPGEYELGLDSSNLGLKGSRLNSEELFFGIFSESQINDMLREASVFKALEARGYPDYIITIQILSELDNRIFIKTPKDEILVHLRLKFNDFYFSRISTNLKMIYIDWLLTQNIKMGKLIGKKKLFDGQEYPGLNIFQEITKFIQFLSLKIGANGIFNVPEYFHDAVLFHKSFKFLDPKKEGVFRFLIKYFDDLTLRKLSNLIHSHKIFNETNKEVYLWKPNEMFYSGETEINRQIFNDEYYDTVEKYKKKYKFKILGNT